MPLLRTASDAAAGKDWGKPAIIAHSGRIAKLEASASRPGVDSATARGMTATRRAASDTHPTGHLRTVADTVLVEPRGIPAHRGVSRRVDSATSLRFASLRFAQNDTDLSSCAQSQDPPPPRRFP